jgi:hypothetical protein
MTLRLVTAPRLDATAFATAMLQAVGVRAVDPLVHRLMLALVRSTFRAGGAR